MGVAVLVLAWVASLAPLLAERAGWLDFSACAAESTPRLAASALCWIALAGLPRSAAPKPDLRGWWGSTLACVPVLALALALDLEGGALRGHGLAAAAAALAFVALCGLAAELARRREMSQRLHAGLWFALFAGLPLLAAASTFGARSSSASAPAWARLGAELSPLAWAEGSLSAAPRPFTALFAALALCAVSAGASRERAA